MLRVPAAWAARANARERAWLAPTAAQPLMPAALQPNATRSGRTLVVATGAGISRGTQMAESPCDRSGTTHGGRVSVCTDRVMLAGQVCEPRYEA
jgi:hypothetical protein